MCVVGGRGCCALSPAGVRRVIAAPPSTVIDMRTGRPNRLLRSMRAECRHTSRPAARSLLPYHHQCAIILWLDGRVAGLRYNLTTHGGLQLYKYFVVFGYFREPAPQLQADMSSLSTLGLQLFGVGMLATLDSSPLCACAVMWVGV